VISILHATVLQSAGAMETALAGRVLRIEPVPKPSRVVAAWGLTIAGVFLPLALVVASLSATHAPWGVLASAVILGTVGPSAGHVVLRRRIFTRGHVVRISAVGASGVLVLAAQRARELGAALGTVAIALVILVIGLVVGVFIDIYDLERWARGDARK
jgi:hypothetical protein